MKKHFPICWVPSCATTSPITCRVFAEPVRTPSMVYRDSLVLLLRFLSARHKRPIAELDLKDLEPVGILAFLSYLEKERKEWLCGDPNVQATAIHALFRFVASRNPEHLGLAQQVLSIPFKRAPRTGYRLLRVGRRSTRFSKR